MSLRIVAENVAESVMPNYAKLKSRPEIAKLKYSDSETIFYANAGDAYPGLRLAVGKRSKSWILSKRVAGKVRSFKLGEWPAVANGDKAMDEARKTLDALNTGTDAESTQIFTLNDAFESHVAHTDAKPQTIKDYRKFVDNHLTDLFAQPIESVTHGMLEDAISGMSVPLAQHLVQIIKMAYRRATVFRSVRDVSANLKVVGVKKYKPNNKVLFDPKDTWLALDLILPLKNPLIRRAWLVMLFTGFRTETVRHLDWDQIDLERKTIKLVSMKNGQDRTFPIADVLVAALAELPHRSGPLFVGKGHTGLMCRMYRFEQLRPHDCRRLFTTACRRARLPAYVIDELRGDTAKNVQDIYDQGSANHADANLVASLICENCGMTPAIVLDQIHNGA